MTTPLPPLWMRIFRPVKLDPIAFEEGKAAYFSKNEKNPHPERTVEHRSWKKGYASVDDTLYVW